MLLVRFRSVFELVKCLLVSLRPLADYSHRDIQEPERVAQRQPHDAIVVCSSDLSSRTFEAVELRQRDIPSHVHILFVEAQQLFQPTSERDCPGRRRWAVRAIEAVTAF